MTGIAPLVSEHLVAILQAGVDSQFVRAVSRVLGFGVVSGLVAVATAFGYRWYVGEPVPRGLAVLLGVGVVALYLNTVGLFGEAVITDPTVPGSGALFEIDNVLFNVGSLAVAAATTPLGRRIGDQLSVTTVAASGGSGVDPGVSRIVRTVGRVTPVTIPSEISDIEGYDPVSSETKERLAGQTLLLPRRLTRAELRDRVVTRLREDYDVGHVDLELDDEGNVTYLGLGARVAGLGPTMGPGTVAVPIRADPPNSASPGDVVQIWTVGPDSDPKRIATAELRAVVGDVVTVTIDEADAGALTLDQQYRLVTLPAEPRVDRMFASLLRRATETMGVVTVGEGSDLVGRSIGTVEATVAAVHSPTEGVEAIPNRSRTLDAGDRLYLVARPDVFRTVEGLASASSDSNE